VKCRQFSVVQCRENTKEDESAGTEQWHYGDVTSVQRLTSRAFVGMEGRTITAPNNVTMLYSFET
jgi:hypothetical protein